MSAYRIADHTADVAVEVEAPTLDGLFAEAAAALRATISSGAEVRPMNRREVALVAPALDLLLVEWLEELLFGLDARGELWGPCEVTVTPAADAAGLAALCWSEPFAPERHPLDVQVKAITYHGLELAEVEGGWRARVLFDI